MSSYGTEVLSEVECRNLAESRSVGRVGVWEGEEPAILPVLYAMLDGDVVFRTAPGEKLIAAARHHRVVFEVDDFDHAARRGWSVNAWGRTEEVLAPAELRRAEALGIEPWAGELRDRYVRVHVERWSGRRIASEEPESIDRD
jgi:hypothetical protein